MFLLLNAVIETLLNAACHQSRSLRGKVRSGPSLLLPLIVESANNFPAVRLWHGVSGILRWGNLQSFANDLSNPGQEGDSLFLAEVSCNIHKRHSSMQPLTNVSCYCFIFVPQVAAIVCCLGVDSSGCRESAPPGCFFLFVFSQCVPGVSEKGNQPQSTVSQPPSRTYLLPKILSSITTDKSRLSAQFFWEFVLWCLRRCAGSQFSIALSPLAHCVVLVFRCVDGKNVSETRGEGQEVMDWINQLVS